MANTIVSIDNNQEYTRYRCKCKDVFKYKGIAYKNKCIDDTTDSKVGVWCQTKDNCGERNAATDTYWDICNLESTFTPFF